MRKLLDYRCINCGRVDEVLTDEGDEEPQRFGFCECRQDGKPVWKVRVYAIRRDDAVDQ